MSLATLPAPTAKAAHARDAGFSFLEVLIALSILLVGSLSILSLFSVGVAATVQRRAKIEAERAKPEVESIAQDLVDQAPGRSLPKAQKGIQLRERGYTVDLRFVAPTAGQTGVHAYGTLRRRGDVVAALGPYVLERTTFDPTAGANPGENEGGGR